MDYKHIHDNLIQYINLCNNDHTSSILNNFICTYFTICYDYVLNDILDIEYIRAMCANNIVGELRMVDIEYPNVDKFYLNILLSFFSTYTHIKLDSCSNCNTITNDDYCIECGYTNRHIVCIEESQKDCYQNNYMFKTKKHNPNKHCEMWLLQLQGKESVCMSSTNLEMLCDHASMYYTYNPNIEFSCSLIRKWLKQFKLTRYNPNVPWIRRQLELHLGIMRNLDKYYFTEYEINDILSIFSQIHNEYDQLTKCPSILYMIRKRKIHNNLYYPYYLIKILNRIITDPNRLAFIMSNIHRQSQRTTYKNDLVWNVLSKRLVF